MFRSFDVIFELRHGIANVLSGGLDVVCCRCADVRVSQDSLNHDVWHTEAIQVASQAASRRMPPMPFRDAIVAVVGMH